MASKHFPRTTPIVRTVLLIASLWPALSCDGRPIDAVPRPNSPQPTVVTEATAAPTPSPTPVMPAFLDPQAVPALSVDAILPARNLPAGRHDPEPSLNLDSQKVTTLIVTGDVIPARYVNYKLTGYNNFKYSFEKTAAFLRTADLTFVDLEAPLVKGCQVTKEGMQFCGDQRFVEGLTSAGVDLVSLANNHARDYGTEGIQQTIQVLRTNGIEYTGNGNVSVEKVGELRFAFLGFNGVGARFNREEIRGKIKEAREAADVVVVAPHWGKEYVSVPTPDAWLAPDDPQEIARFMIDAGADLVVGNHPHWVQGIEVYKGKLIVYAHGNFVFDQNDRETHEGVIGKYTFYGPKLLKAEFFPILIEDWSQPRFLSNKDGAPILKRMREASAVLARR